MTGESKFRGVIGDYDTGTGGSANLLPLYWRTCAGCTPCLADIRG